jgi:hypothetical protein
MLRSGVFLSGNKVIADEASAGALRSVWRRAAAIDMEAAGVASALYHLKAPPAFIIFKGICDYADSKRNDRWQEYAADSAASCTFSFVLDHLRQIDIRSPQKRMEEHPNKIILDTIRVTYNMTELRQLVFKIGVDWDEGVGNIKSEKIIELVLYLQRRKTLGKMIDIVNDERDNILKAFAGGID